MKTSSPKSNSSIKRIRIEMEQYRNLELREAVYPRCIRRIVLPVLTKIRFKKGYKLDEN